MVLVIASCWLAPLQSRSKWVLLSFPVLWVWSFPPCFGTAAKHIRWNPSWSSSVCWMVILLRRVCPAPLYLFFFFVTLVYVHCDGDIGVDDDDDDGRRHSTYQSKTRDWASVTWVQTLPRENFSRGPVLSAPRCTSSCVDKWTWPGPVVLLVFPNSFSCRLLHRIVC